MMMSQRVRVDTSSLNYSLTAPNPEANVASGTQNVATVNFNTNYNDTASFPAPAPDDDESQGVALNLNVLPGFGNVVSVPEGMLTHIQPLDGDNPNAGQGTNYESNPTDELHELNDADPGSTDDDALLIGVGIGGALLGILALTGVVIYFSRR
jgi:hypothetical protein